MNLLSFNYLCLLALILYQVNLIDARHAHGTDHSHHAHRHNINKNGEDSALPISSPVFPSNRSSEPLLELETKYREVLQYHHNSTSDRSDWSVGKSTQADTVWNGGNPRDAQYETQHVLEG